MFCPRTDSPDNQALSVNVLLKRDQRRSACARSLIWAVLSRVFKCLCCKTSAFHFAKQQNLGFNPSLRTTGAFQRNPVYTLFFKIIVFCVLTPLTGVSCLEELHFFDSVITLHQTWCLLWVLCLSALNWSSEVKKTPITWWDLVKMSIFFKHYFLNVTTVACENCYVWFIVYSLSFYA